MPLIKHEGAGQINAVREGVRAAHNGIFRDRNPHEKGSVLFAAWDNGWVMGKDEWDAWAEDQDRHNSDYRIAA